MPIRLKKIQKIIARLPDVVKWPFKLWLATYLLKKGPNEWAQNVHYDRLTIQIIKKVLSHKGNAVDVGAGQGTFLHYMRRSAPQGIHYAFEPIPVQFQKLQRRFGKYTHCRLFNLALSDQSGPTKFFVVNNDLGYSGLKITGDAHSRHGSQGFQEIEADARRLDELIDPTHKIAFIKMDVEGAELKVLQGATQLLQRDKPTLVFECSAHAESYGVQPGQIFDFFQTVNLKVYTLKGYVEGTVALDRQEFCTLQESGREFYFVAGI